MIWNEEADEVLAESKRFKFHLPAPKMPLPGHAESYNPPAEYLLTPEEQAAMEGKHPSLVLVLFITPLLYCPYFTLLLYRPYLDPFTLT